MIALDKLREYLLEQLQNEEVGSSKYHQVHLLIGQFPYVANAQQFVNRLHLLVKEQQELVELVNRKVEVSYLWDVWGYYPLERIEGPYEREKAYECMKELNSVVLPDGRKRPHVIVIVGSDQEARYQAIVARRRGESLSCPTLPPGSINLRPTK